MASYGDGDEGGFWDEPNISICGTEPMEVCEICGDSENYLLMVHSFQGYSQICPHCLINVCDMMDIDPEIFGWSMDRFIDSYRDYHIIETCQRDPCILCKSLKEEEDDVIHIEI